MVTTAIYTVIALITGKSLRSTAIIISARCPEYQRIAQSKAPISKAGRLAITSVTIGIDALRKT